MRLVWLMIKARNLTPNDQRETSGSVSERMNSLDVTHVDSHICPTDSDRLIFSISTRKVMLSQTVATVRLASEEASNFLLRIGSSTERLYILISTSTPAGR